jgi:hypothetical protein
LIAINKSGVCLIHPQTKVNIAHPPLSFFFELGINICSCYRTFW